MVGMLFRMPEKAILLYLGTCIHAFHERGLKEAAGYLFVLF
jgi:hypothetical protein